MFWIIPKRVGTRLRYFDKRRCNGDHPHACGDKCKTTMCRMRRRRIIPTRVGTSGEGNAKMIDWEDHPHAYGDKEPFLISCFYNRGSSPRVWGQVSHSLFLSALDRIIPTRMGTRSGRKSVQAETKDHPHAYGDKTLMFGFVEVCHGSSPRVWGQVIFSPLATRLARIIPTRMGTSISQQIDNYVNNKSSPRVWGQAMRSMRDELLQRIIPTRMGTRTAQLIPLTLPEDHPHACGDK